MINNKRYIIYTMVAVIMPLTFAFAQEQLTLRDRADLLFQRYEYARAAEIYERLADRAAPRIQDVERAAESYYRMRDFASAEKWYAKLVKHKDHIAPHVLDYADILKSNGKYVAAKTWFQKYADQTGLQQEVDVKIAGCDSALHWMAMPTAHVLRNEQAVNTPRSEFSVSLIDGVGYYAGEPSGELGAVRDNYGWTGQPFLKIYRAGIGASLELTSPSMMSNDLNDPKYHVGPIASPDGGQTLYVTRTYVGADASSEVERGRRYRTHRLELYQYTKKKGSWVSTPFVHNDVDNHSVGHATFSSDGNIIYFASDRSGGFGGTDIWYSERQSDGSWGVAVNAGSSVNTSGDELFPAIGADGNLYYATDGLAGMGGLDVFRSNGNKADWSVPVNLGYPVNSPEDDFAYVVVEDTEQQVGGYLSSNRREGKGSDDIYSFVFAKPQPIVILLEGVVTDKRTSERLAGATVVLLGGETPLTGKSRDDGSFEFLLDPDQIYAVKGTLSHYTADSASVNTMDVVKSDTLHVALALEPGFVVGTTFMLENIHYDFDKHNIRPDAAEILDELVATMREYPTLKIELSSHTDSRGSHEYNIALSQRRAQAAVDYLVSRGIARDRMVAQGYGETRLINECADGVPCTREQHQANRRTEVTVLEL